MHYIKKIHLLLFTLITINVFGQESNYPKADAIVEEGKLLYKSEMASWYGTDLFLEQYKEQENIEGYFSYLNYGIPTCIFYSESENPKVIGTITFDSTYNPQTAIVNLEERDFSVVESDLYKIRKLAKEAVFSDTFFKSYKNTNFNLVPIINKKEKKVYVLTGPKEEGVVIFGNDYLLLFDESNQLVSKARLHNNILPISSHPNTKDGQKITGTVHSHLPETGDFMTATDICTLMLYERFTDWESHNVVSSEYLNIWNCKTNRLSIIPMKTVQKVNKDLKKRNNKKK